jgi:hypothetical protein
MKSGVYHRSLARSCRALAGGLFVASRDFDLGMALRTYGLVFFSSLGSSKVSVDI